MAISRSLRVQLPKHDFSWGNRSQTSPLQQPNTLSYGELLYIPDISGLHETTPLSLVWVSVFNEMDKDERYNKFRIVIESAETLYGYPYLQVYNIINKQFSIQGCDLSQTGWVPVIPLQKPRRARVMHFTHERHLQWPMHLHICQAHSYFRESSPLLCNYVLYIARPNQISSCPAAILFQQRIKMSLASSAQVQIAAR